MVRNVLALIAASQGNKKLCIPHGQYGKIQPRQQPIKFRHLPEQMLQYNNFPYYPQSQ